MSRLKQTERLELAREFLADVSNDELQAATIWKVMHCWRITDPAKAERLLTAEKLKRGIVTFADLTPDLRRAFVSAENLDLRALADGPIMDAANIYCPLGKLSMAETRAREARQVLP